MTDAGCPSNLPPAQNMALCQAAGVATLSRVHAKGRVFCLLSIKLSLLRTLLRNLAHTEKPLQAPFKNPSKKHLLLENLLRTLLRVPSCCMTPLLCTLLRLAMPLLALAMLTEIFLAAVAHDAGNLKHEEI